MKNFRIVIFALSVCFSFETLPTEANQTIIIPQLANAPVVDGIADDWPQTPASVIPVFGKLAIEEVAVKAGVFGDTIYLAPRCFKWVAGNRVFHRSDKS